MNIKGSKKLFLPILSCVGLSACDIGPGAMKSGFDKAGDEYVVESSSSSSSSVVATSATVSGAVVKGVVGEGTVSLYGFSNGQLNDNPITTTTTNAQGQYTAVVQNYVGPVYVQVTPDQSTTMKCDFPSGCGADIAFGATVPLSGSNLRLGSLVSDLGNNDTAQTNVSTLTHIASQVALQRIADEGTVTNTGMRDAINNAYSAVANRFGLQGNLNTQPVVDLTDPLAVSNANTDSLRYNVLNSAVVGSVITEVPGTSISDAVDRFAAQFRNSGGLADTETEVNLATTTFAEIAAEAQRVIDAVRRSMEGLGDTLPLRSLANTMTTELETALQGSTVPTQGTPATTYNSDLAALKAFVGEVRKVGTAVSDGFVDENALVDAVFDQDSGVVIAALSIAGEAIGAAWDARQDNSEMTTFVDPGTGVTVAITAGAESVSYTVDGVVVAEGVNVDVAMTAVDNGTTLESNSTEVGETLDAAANFSVTGSLASPNASLDVTSGTFTVVDAAGSVTETQAETTTTTTTLGVESMGFNLNISLTEATNTNADPVTFTGKLGLSLTGVDVSDTATMTGTGDSALESFVTTLASDTVQATFSGKFSAASGKWLTAAMSVTADFTGYDPQAEETEDNYVAMSFSNVISLPSLGELISVPIKISMSGDRNGLDTTDTLVTVTYGAVTLTASYDTAEEQATTQTIQITNPELATFTLTDTDSVISGSVVYKSETATISQQDNLVMVTYSDETSESLW